MKLFAMLLLAWLLVLLVVDEVEGGSCLKRAPCSRCGRGARCVFGLYCTAFCKTVTIKNEGKFRKYCPRKTQANPFNHLISKRSVSHTKRSTNMVEIVYKAPFLVILKSLQYEQSSTARREILTEIADDVATDAENCDTPTNVLARIEWLARRAARSAVSASSGRPTYGRPTYGRPSGLSSGSYEYYVRQMIQKFNSLDDDDIDCEVEESSPLAQYERGSWSGSGYCFGCPASTPYCTGICRGFRGGCRWGSCSATPRN